jgi:hypothetical protein
VASELGTRRDQENEGATVSLLGWIRWPIIETPQQYPPYSSRGGHSTKIDSVIDNEVRALPAYQIRYGVSVMVLEVAKRCRAGLSAAP